MFFLATVTREKKKKKRIISLHERIKNDYIILRYHFFFPVGSSNRPYDPSKTH